MHAGKVRDIGEMEGDVRWGGWMPGGVYRLGDCDGGGGGV